jgi:BirA family biotin operon repressor/biotin-[acetyl-CoA-carboxylase] ligase
LAAAYALTRVLSVNYGIRAGIRWPNDLLVQGRKLAGVLTEAGLGPRGVEWGLLGMGVNTNLRLGDLPPEVRGEATTLLEILDRPIDNGRLLTKLLDEFWAYYTELRSGSLEALRRAIGRTLAPRRVLVETQQASYQGEVVGLDGQGRLVIRTGMETIALGPNDVVYLRPLMAKG